MEAIKTLFKSKKFWLTIIGSAVVTLLVQVLPLIGIDGEIAMQIVTYVAGFFGVNILGQGLADLGKEAKK